MINLSSLLNSENVILITYAIKTFFIITITYYTFLRLTNIKNFFNIKFALIIFINIFITFGFCYIKYNIDSFTAILLLIFVLGVLYSKITKNKFATSLLTTTIALSMNYCLFVISSTFCYFIRSYFKISNDYINLLIMILIHSIFINIIFKIKRFKNGFSFLRKNFDNEYFNILILNISVIILFSLIILNNVDYFLFTNLYLSILLFATIMFITIQKTFAMYYKHKLLVTELNDTKAELEEKNKEIAELEAENLQFSKTSHSIAHKQKSLEHKLNELMMKTEVATELDIRDRLDEISNECFVATTTSLPKTDVEIIDDMLSYMQSECKENNIDFELQLNGNIHHMINNFVAKEDLEILLADHIKDAIIAINYSDNVNKSILVKLGLFDGDYSLSIYDSGIEFEITTLIELGIKPSTTHKDDGGTGMGFMNTFDTLKKYNASLYINEIVKPSKDNYTKSVTISFNSKNEYKVLSYRTSEIREKNNRDNLIIL